MQTLITRPMNKFPVQSKILFNSSYKHYPLVNYCDIGQTDCSKSRYILSLHNVINTPKTHIGYFVKNGKIMLFTSIDNLWKGAASQAIENINQLYQLPIQTGLSISAEAL